MKQNKFCVCDFVKANRWNEEHVEILQVAEILFVPTSKEMPKHETKGAS